MPRIRGASIEEHHEMVWADLAEANIASTFVMYGSAPPVR